MLDAGHLFSVRRRGAYKGRWRSRRGFWAFLRTVLLRLSTLRWWRIGRTCANRCRRRVSQRRGRWTFTFRPGGAGAMYFRCWMSRYMRFDLLTFRTRKRRIQASGTPMQSVATFGAKVPRLLNKFLRLNKFWSWSCFCENLIRHFVLIVPVRQCQCQWVTSRLFLLLNSSSVPISHSQISTVIFFFLRNW